MKSAIVKNSAAALLLIVLVLDSAVSAAPEYPPDNAAVLYYKMCLMYHAPEAEIREELYDVIAGKTEPTDKFVEFIEGQDYIVEVVMTASQIKSCDWGHNLSKGFMMRMPTLAHLRKISMLVLADAVILAKKGDCSTAADRCIATYRMAQHIKDGVLICNLVGIAIEKATTTVVQQILATPEVDAKTLRKLKIALDEIAAANTGLVKCMQSEIAATTTFSTPEEIVRIAIMESGSDVKASDYDKELCEKSIVYYKKHMDRMVKVMELPYAEAVAGIKELNDKMQADTKKKPEAVLSAVLVPAIGKVLSTDVKARTDINALRTAVEIYLIKATTGKLPDSLPAQMPKDMFSGRHFEYKTTKTGFTLRCRAKNLKTDKIEEYAFKVAK